MRTSRGIRAAKLCMLADLSLGAATTASGQTATPSSTAAPAAANSQTDPQGADATSSELRDIIVTAEKRSTSLQRTPLAVTALNGDALANTQVNNLQSVAALAPSAKVGDVGGYAQISIRGIGSQSGVPLTDSPVAVNINEIYISRPVSFLSSMFDVSAVEVLRGPQGTLYGRNATAGSINITTARPTEQLSGFGRFSYSAFNQKRAEAAVGGAIVPDFVSIRVAGFYEDRDGYGRNVTTGRDVDDKNAYGFRGTVLVTPTPEISATLIAERYRERDSGAALHYFGAAGLIPVSGTFGSLPFATLFGGTVLSNSYDVANDTQPRFYLGVTTLTGLLEYNKGPFTVRSVTGYRRQRAYTLSDLDNSNLPLGFLAAGENDRQFSQELQLRYNSQRVNLTLGGYYFREIDDATPYVVPLSSRVTDPILASLGVMLPPRAPVLLNFGNLGGTIYTRAFAIFGQGTFNVTDRLSVTAGLRYSTERRRLVQRYLIDPITPYSPELPPPPGLGLPGRTYSSATPRVALEFQVTPRTLLYASYARGFKSGSFDPSADPATTTSPSFGPENLNSYEVGLKSTLLDGKLRTNLAAFYYDYSGLQVLQTRGFGIATTNAGKAREYGLEAEITALPVHSLELSLSGSLLNAKYLDYTGVDAARIGVAAVDFSGKRLNNAPSASGLISAQYTVPFPAGSLLLRGETELTSRFFFSPANYDELSQSGYAKLNAFLTYTAQRGWSIGAFGRNLTNRKTKTSSQVQTVFLGTPITGSLAPPRTYGVTVGVKF